MLKNKYPFFLVHQFLRFDTSFNQRIQDRNELNTAQDITHYPLME